MNNLSQMSTGNKFSHSKPYSQSQSCPIPVGNSLCGETNSLEIMKEFNKLFEDRMQQVDSIAGGDCLQEKIKLQQEWIQNLTQQNEMLVKAVQDLEYEATERVKQLEDKLHKNAQCLCEVMKKYREFDFSVDLLSSPIQKITQLENDKKNLLEFINRIRDNQDWSIDGLFFYNVAPSDLLGPTNKICDKSVVEVCSTEGEEILKTKDRALQELTQKLNYINSFGDVECMVKELQCRREECESLKEAMADMRQALTEEVASKHDQIILLKREMQVIEETCAQAEKQIIFKDDIIKELRKDIKQLKQQNSRAVCYEKDTLSEKMVLLEKENANLKQTLVLEKSHIEELDVKFKEFLENRDELKKRIKVFEKQLKKVSSEKETVDCECNRLKAELRAMRKEKEKLLSDVEFVGKELCNVKAESANCQDKIKEILKKNKSAVDQILSLNEENRHLSDNIDALRQRADYAASFTQDEISKLTTTIDELQQNLEKTKVAQDEEEKAHHSQISNLNNIINGLEHDLKVFKQKAASEQDAKICKICKGKSKVGFLEHTEVQTNLGPKESELSKALNESKLKMTQEIERRDGEIEHLKCKVNELELALNSCEERASNLQEAVMLMTFAYSFSKVSFYSNSLNILESAEKQDNLQIEQQRITISNLQQALVESKQELDRIQKKWQDNENIFETIMKIVENNLERIKSENDHIKKQLQSMYVEHEQLQDLNFCIEVDQCSSLQDVDILEDRLSKYKTMYKEKEVESMEYKDQVKKLSKQKRCYEEIIAYFKHEMVVMAEQLNSLQELLTLSNESAQQESNKIMQAFLEVQTLNEKLSTQLCACEQKAQLENQMNQMHEAKICELQQIIKKKEIDLTTHDQAILNIHQTLNDSLKQNEALQSTIAELNETINNLREDVNKYERENCETRNSTLAFQEQIDCYCDKLEQLRKDLDEKTAQCLKLEMAYNSEKRALKMTQKQLHEKEELQQESVREMMATLEGLKCKLNLTEGNNGKLSQECEALQNQVAKLSRKEAIKDLEIKRYRKIVGELKTTMMELNSELNKNLAQKELKGSCKNTSCNRDLTAEDHPIQDACLNCPCEIEFYQKMIDILKKSVIDLKQQLSDTQTRNEMLDQEIKRRDAQLFEFDKLQAAFQEKLQESDISDQRIAELEQEVDHLRRELDVSTLQLEDVRKTSQEINGSKCVQLACAQEEISNLKSELASVLDKQYKLKNENEFLQSQTTQLHCTITCLLEENKVLKEQADQYLQRLKNLNTDKETLICKNKELLKELKSLQSMSFCMDKQQRLTTDLIKHLETDVEDLRYNKEEICLESKSVIKNVRAWVEEQKMINALVSRREQMFLDTIKKLNGEKEALFKRNPFVKVCPKSQRTDFALKTTCRSPCSLGSQGTPSVYDIESPPASPDMYDWYSSTFKTESDLDSDEDYCVNTLENLTQQMKNSNKMWLKEQRTCTQCKTPKDCSNKK
ncbi:uncharacterized protein LOC143202871 isoform X3 [Rhynchophorus ferrugineus]|uniref:uncharacterized protein LOC143202871 isoform X3 n=1 Tax=Rhynchophorus ferrugineus TaxID=354439 RepID=UPI003FCD58A4